MSFFPLDNCLKRQAAELEARKASRCTAGNKLKRVLDSASREKSIEELVLLSPGELRTVSFLISFL